MLDGLTAIVQNIAKVTGNMANCIRRDPRRRFVFGFTIENIDMRLWYCDRDSIVASQPFNFITVRLVPVQHMLILRSRRVPKDHLSLIHFLLSVMHAKPHQLGWDNTMTPLPDGLNFDITVHSHGQDRTYRTQKLLFDRGSRILLGKATRVWQALLVENWDVTGPLVALKDCWVERGRTREGDNLRRIRHDILAVSPEDEDFVGHLFPCPEWDGDVHIGDEATLDLTRTISERPADSEPVADQGNSNERLRESGASPDENLVHYRLVLSPAGEKSVENETSPSKIFQTLAHAAAGKPESGCVTREIYITLMMSVELFN